MNLRRFRPIAAILAAICVGGCAGSSCSGLAPLPNGFKLEERIENAGSIRLTSEGLGFFEQNIDVLAKSLLGLDTNKGVLTVPLPGDAGASATICPSGPDPSSTPPSCVAEVDLGSSTLAVDAIAPNELRMSGDILIRVQDLPIDLTPGGPFTLSLNGNGACAPSMQTYAPINATVGIGLAADTKTVRLGYTKGTVAEVTIDKQGLKDALHVCGSNVVIPDEVIDLLHAQVVSSISASIEEQLCLAADSTLPLPCPKGTHDVDGICRYGLTAADECVGRLIGAEGNMDLGLALSTVSPGAKAHMDYLFALGGASARPDGMGKFGDLNPINGGATLGLYAGLTANPTSACVTPASLKLPTGIPVPDEMLGNTVSDWPAGMAGPHVGVALSERFLNYALGQAYNSGFLCLAVSTTAIDLLNSGTIALIANSVKDLTIQQETEQVAVVVRPSAPPTAIIGGGTSLPDDPLLRLKLDQVSFDLYVWSLDRFVRFMTVTLDVDAPLNLTVTPDGLQPTIDKIGVSNAVVTNSPLLREDPTKVAAAFTEVVSGLVGQSLGQALAPINLNDLLFSGIGLNVTIPESVDGKGSPGLRKLTKDTDNFLGIFGAASPAGAPKAPAPLAPNAHASILEKDVVPAGVHIATMTAENAPLVSIEMGSDADGGDKEVEYSYRVDQALWKPFTRARVVNVDDPWIRLQGRHVIEVRSRFVGDPMSLDAEPAALEVLIDVDPPSIALGEVDAASGKAPVTVSDFVSGDNVQVRSRLDDGAWSAWGPASEATAIDVGAASELSVEARDEEGNVASASQSLIRGGPIVGAAGCGCVAAGDDAPTGPWAGFCAAAFAALAIRIAKRR